MNRPTLFSKLCLVSEEVDLESCAVAIGLLPTEILRRGDSRGEGRMIVPESSWEVSCPQRVVFSVDESVVELLDLIWPYRENLVSFCKVHRIDCLIVTVAYINEDKRPVYDFGANTLRRMAELQCSWIMDLV